MSNQHVCLSKAEIVGGSLAVLLANVSLFFFITSSILNGLGIIEKCGHYHFPVVFSFTYGVGGMVSSFLTGLVCVQLGARYLDSV
jgi:hypothetical protein